MMLFCPWRLWQLSLGDASKKYGNFSLLLPLGGRDSSAIIRIFQFVYDDIYEAGIRPWWSQPERHSRCHWHQYEPTCPYDEPAGIVSFHFHNRFCQLDYCWHFHICTFHHCQRRALLKPCHCYHIVLDLIHIFVESCVCNEWWDIQTNFLDTLVTNLGSV